MSVNGLSEASQKYIQRARMQQNNPSYQQPVVQQQDSVELSAKQPKKMTAKKALGIAAGIAAIALIVAHFFKKGTVDLSQLKFTDGLAMKDGEKFTGVLETVLKSGKKATIKYKNGELVSSVVKSNAGEEVFKKLFSKDEIGDTIVEIITKEGSKIVKPKQTAINKLMFPNGTQIDYKASSYKPINGKKDDLYKPANSKEALDKVKPETKEYSEEEIKKMVEEFKAEEKAAKKAAKAEADKARRAAKKEELKLKTDKTIATLKEGVKEYFTHNKKA